MANVHVAILFFVLFIYREVITAKLVTSKDIRTEDGQHYTWNFIFSGNFSDMNFSETQITEDSNESDSAKDEDGGVYWREWNGVMPKDAIVGGYTVNQCGIQVTIYLAQATIIGGQAGLQPAQIFNYSKEIITSFEGIHKTSKTIKILCSRHSKSVVWMPYSRVSNLDADKVFVIAGFERDFNLFFGRANRINDVIIGKVLHKDQVLRYPRNGNEESEKNFEVLCYRKRLIEENIIPQDST